MPIPSKSLLAGVLTIRRPIIPQLIIITLLVVEIGIKTIIINIKIIIIRAIAIIIGAKVTIMMIIGGIEIGGAITPLKDKKKRISIRIKNLRGTPA